MPGMIFTKFGSVFMATDGDELVVMIVGRAPDPWLEFFLCAVLADGTGLRHAPVIHVPARNLADGDYWELLG